MSYEQDWTMRQIKSLTSILARLIFHTDIIEYTYADENSPSAADAVHRLLLELLAEGKICEAEDFLFLNFHSDSPRDMELAADFYQRLNLLSDSELTAGNFSREEIEDGLRDILHRAGISLPEG